MQNLQKAISMDHLTGPFTELMRQNSERFVPPNPQLTAVALEHFAASSPWTEPIETGLAASRAREDVSEPDERENELPGDSDHEHEDVGDAEKGQHHCGGE